MQEVLCEVTPHPHRHRRRAQQQRPRRRSKVQQTPTHVGIIRKSSANRLRVVYPVDFLVHDERPATLELLEPRLLRAVDLTVTTDFKRTPVRSLDDDGGSYWLDITV